MRFPPLQRARAAAHHDEDYDGRTEDGRDRADAELGGGKDRARGQIAEQTEYCAAGKARRYLHERLCRAEQPLHQLRNRNADERDRPGERSHAGGEHAREQDERGAEGADIDAHAARAALAELIGAHRLGQQHGEGERDQHDRRHHADIVP